MRLPSRASAWACCWLGLGVACAQTAPATATPGASDALAPAILDVRINGQSQPAPRPLLRRGAQWLVAEPDLEAWRLVKPAAPALHREGTDYYDLQALPGAQLRLDESTQSLELTVPAEAFASGPPQAAVSDRPPLSPSAFGAFLNYDLALQHDRDGTRLSGYFDAAASGEWGLVGTSFVTGQSAFGGSSGNGGRGTTRLDSYFRRDDPVRLTRLTVGDSVTQAAAWSTPFRFGGVQFGTRFGLQPGYISYPMPTLRGGAAVPSAVEVYVNDTLRYQRRVDAGPFALSDVPVLTGAGEMRFAVTDALGVQRTVTTPYYVSSNLLRAGLSDYSLEAGWTRLRYGERSFDYGPPFVAGTWRYGVNDSVTVEARGEASARSQTAGAGVTWVWGTVGEFSLHGAASRSRDGQNGRLWRAAYTRTSDEWNFSVSRQVASRGFTQIAWHDSPVHTDAQTQVFAGRSLGRWGTLGASHTQLHYNTGEHIGVTTASWSIGVGGNAWLGTYVARTRQDGKRPTTSVGLSLTFALGERRHAALSLQRENTGRHSAVAEVVQQPPGDAGWGWRLRAADGDNARSEAGVDLRGRYGMLTAEAARAQGQTAVRLRASGAVGLAGGLPFATRQSDDAFALVTVPGAANVKVYRENQPWTTTDSEGRAVVSGLRAYEPNHISIDNGDLPIEAQVRSDALRVVPRFKGVAQASFDIARDTVANVTVLLPDGTPLPPGIDVARPARGTSLLSGFHGLVSIEDPQPGESLEARWKSGHCRFTLGAPDRAAGALPAMGPYRCLPVSPPPR
ncbi:fimbria/pilus outer membrane usher protein [Acidovorax cavernicola]|uniref:fimbria/pilus outer membrane usher protein n=1 Tax=Acidovorax cavernicola TaxID=1675792 RepID=UPI00142D7959|nr:fimbria/pilus outer membrane usher protein [Acidovorax cavernicola]